MFEMFVWFQLNFSCMMKKEIVIESFHGSQINNQRIVNL